MAYLCDKKIIKMAVRYVLIFIICIVFSVNRPKATRVCRNVNLQKQP